MFLVPEAVLAVVAVMAYRHTHGTLLHCGRDAGVVLRGAFSRDVDAVLRAVLRAVPRSTEDWL